MANPHADLPAGTANEKDSSTLGHKEFLGKVCKESQYHLTGEASVLNNKPSAHEHSFTTSSGESENLCYFQLC